MAPLGTGAQRSAQGDVVPFGSTGIEDEFARVVGAEAGGYGGTRVFQSRFGGLATAVDARGVAEVLAQEGQQSGDDFSAGAGRGVAVEIDHGIKDSRPKGGAVDAKDSLQVSGANGDYPSTSYSPQPADQ